jgi:hypothetical protein
MPGSIVRILGEDGEKLPAGETGRLGRLELRSEATGRWRQEVGGARHRRPGHFDAEAAYMTGERDDRLVARTSTPERSRMLSAHSAI